MKAWHTRADPQPEPSRTAEELAKELSKSCKVRLTGAYEASISFDKDVAERLAQSALTAAYERGKAEALPRGWVAVPEEPTEEMKEKGKPFLTNGKIYAEATYRSMLASRPPVPDANKKEWL